MTKTLDLKDKKILNEIEMNARITHAELAKKLKTSKQVVKYRIKNLEKQNIVILEEIDKNGETG